MPKSAPVATTVSLSRSDVGRAVAVVDVEPVGLAADDGDLGTGLTEGARGDLRGSSVRGVDDDVQSLEPVRQGGQQVGDIAVGAVGERRDAADVAAGGALPLVAQPVLDAVLEVVGELVPAPGEELDAVVGHRVVRGREHGTEVGVLLAHEVGDGRRGQHAGVAHVDAGRGEAGHGRRGEELARGPGVASDDGNGSVAVEGAHLARTCAAATERSSASSAVMSLFATPRTPSVPKSRATLVCLPEGCDRRAGRRCARTTIPPESRTGVPAASRPGVWRGAPRGAPGGHGRRDRGRQVAGGRSRPSQTPSRCMTTSVSLASSGETAPERSSATIQRMPRSR